MYYIIKSKNKLEGRHPEESIGDPKNKGTEERSRRQRRMKACCDGDQSPEGVVAPQTKWMVGWIIL